MKNLSMISLCLVFIAFAGSALAADMGGSLGHDLDALWATAQQNHDLDNEDAVLLLESRLVSLNPDGTKSTRVHRVVWIGTAMGIRSYADLRVPWDTETSELEVEILRTWMDNRWWPDVSEISETAVVHTLPYAVRTAHDYTTMRETMLLHDGVELPCIMETAYTITEQPAFDYADDLFVMPQRDPAVKVEYQVVAPGETEVLFEDLNGQAAPVVDNLMGNLVLTWTMDDAPALKMPITAAPERYEPALVWSTWPDWGTVQDTWESRIDEDAVLSPALADTLAVFNAEHPALGTRIHALVAWLNSSVRPVAYDPSYWFGRSRNAMRTWETGYGHELDRAILLQAMLDERHAKVKFRGVGESAVAPDVPRLTGLGDLVVRDETSDSYIDMAHGTVLSAPLVPSTFEGVAQSSTMLCGTMGLSGEYSLKMSVEPEDDGSFTGTGTIRTTGSLTNRTRLTATAGGAAGFLGEVLGSVLEGAELTAWTPLLVQTSGAEFQFDFTLPSIPENAFGKKALVIGQPASSLLSILPHDVDPGMQSRESPVLLGHGLTQYLEISFKGTLAELPEENEMEGEVGGFHLVVNEEHGWTTIRRDLVLKGGRVAPEQWPALRALLLEEQDPRHGTILFD